jgi:hypothetical protein
MDDESSHTQPAHQQQQRVYIAAESNTPIEATIRTLDVDPATLIGREILRRHKLLGTLQRLRSKSEEDGRLSRAASSYALIFLSMVIYHGKAKEHCAGLVVTDGPDELADSVGLKASAAWPALRRLEGVGMIRRIRVGRGNDHFEVMMPVLDDEQSSQLVRGDKLAPEPAPHKDLDSTQWQARAQLVVIGRALDTGRAPEPGERAPGDELDGGRAPECPGARAPSVARAQSLLTGRAQPDFSAENAVARAGARASERARAPIYEHDHDEYHDVGLTGAGGKDAEQLLRAIEIGGRRLDAGGIRKLLTSPKCTPENIAAAVTITTYQFMRRKEDRKFNPMRYVYALIFNGCTPPLTPEERRRAAMPEHEQEQLALDAEGVRVAQARERAEREAIAALEPAALQQLIDAVIEQTPEAWHRAHFTKQRHDPANSILLRQAIYQRLQPKGAQQA